MTASNARAIEQSEDMLHRGYADLTSLCKGNLDAMLASGQVMISGSQSLGAELLAFYQSRMKNSLEAGKRLTECTSPQAVLELQVELVQSSLKAYVDEFRKVGDLTGKVVSEAFAPLNRRARQVGANTQESVAA